MILRSWTIVILIAAAYPLSAAAAPNLDGLKLGDSEDALKQISLTLKGKDDDAPDGPATAYKYTTDNGNDLSITFKGGKAVWIENDWENQPDGDESLIKGLVFDKTTLADIDVLMGSNGYTHRSAAFRKMGDMLVTINCYGLSDQPGTSIVFITSVSMGANPDDVKKYMNQAFRLRGIILAEDDYIDALWKPDIVKDPAYHEVPWSAVDRQPTDASVTALKHSVDLLLSTTPTQGDGFSLTLPVGFHRLPSPDGATGFYMYADMAVARRMLTMIISDTQPGTSQSSVLEAMLLGLSRMHQDFEHSAPATQTVSGTDFACASWSGTKDSRLFAGRVCVTDKGGHQFMYTDLDYKHRYDDDAAIYQQVFGSLKLQ